MNLAWYLRRLQRMEPSELIGRANDQILRLLWQVRPPDVAELARRHRVVPQTALHLMPLGDPSQAPLVATKRLLACADEILNGRWEIFAEHHPDFGERPDWFVDARSGKRMPSSDYSFSIPYRDEARVGNIKYVWEASRHHHLTLLAAAYYISRDDRYAQRIADHLGSWWRENPFMRGPHWLSGIELGLRLIAWSWTRRLLAPWREAPNLFENNDGFITQLYGHQLWLSRLPSRGSSANNHIIAEAAGQFAAASVFPVFTESERWRSEAAQTLVREANAQTFASGSNRELATDYHGFVLELLLAAVLQAGPPGNSISDELWTVICRMTDTVAAMLDDHGMPPRQGDGDDGIGLLLDGHGGNRWMGLLSMGKQLFGPQPWWPDVPEDDVRTFLWTAGLKEGMSFPRAGQRPHLLEDAGQVYLTGASPAGRIWCRCDNGPHGFGRIAAHAHADALSIELRIDGVEIFADPGTYCYHGDPRWRDYFRSTFAHNTLCLGSRDQSQSGGPFLWTRHAEARLIGASGLHEQESEASWVGEHSGYLRDTGLTHRRSVNLSRRRGQVVIEDKVVGMVAEPISASLSWHLGPSVDCHLDGSKASLSWPEGRAELNLPAQMSWSCYRGDEVLPAGWYSPSFDRKVPAVALVGRGTVDPTTDLRTELNILAAGKGL